MSLWSSSASTGSQSIYSSPHTTIRTSFTLQYRVSKRLPSIHTHFGDEYSQAGNLLQLSRYKQTHIQRQEKKEAQTQSWSGRVENYRYLFLFCWKLYCYANLRMLTHRAMLDSQCSIVLFAIHISCACHVYKTLHFKYKFNNTDRMSLLYFEKSTFGMSRSGRYFACDRRVWSSRVGSSRVTQNRPVDIFLSLSLSLSLSLCISLHPVRGIGYRRTWSS